MQRDGAGRLQDPPTDQQPRSGASVHYVTDMASRRGIAVGEARESVGRPRIPNVGKALLALSLALNIGTAAEFCGTESR